MTNRILPTSVLYSKEKMDLLSLLRDEPIEKWNIQKKLGISSQKLSPQLIELTDTKIITFQDNKYALSAMGDLLLTEITSALDALRFFDNDYWWDHNFSFIPSTLLRRLCRIKDWTVLQPDSPEIYDQNRKIHEKSILSASVSTVTATLHPYFFKFTTEVINNSKTIAVIFDHMTLDKVKTDNREEIQKVLNDQHFRLYLYPGPMDLFSFLVNDSFFALRPLTNDGMYDHTQLISNSQEAVELGRELFTHYVQKSKSITEI